MDDRAREFHLQEYTALRAEMLTLIERSGANRNFMFVSVAAIVAWLLTNGRDIGPGAGLIAAWLPFLLVRYFQGFRADQSEAVGRLAAYLLRIETTLGAEDLGWEKSIAKKGDRDAKALRMYRRSKHIFIYASAATLLFALYFMAQSRVWLIPAQALDALSAPPGAAAG